jgi:Nucleotidyltransferase domain
MNVAELPVQFDREQLAEFCRARGIRKLSLFGSVLREDFDPGRSDVDALAEFNPGALDTVVLALLRFWRGTFPSARPQSGFLLAPEQVHQGPSAAGGHHDL